MTAVDDLIADLRENRISDRDQPVTCNIDTLIAALQQLGGGSSGAAGSSLVTGSRPSLTSGVPVLTASVTAAATIFFTPLCGNKTLINQGSGIFSAVTHGELSQALNDATKSPAAAGANETFNLFVWEDGGPGGTVRCTRGPAIAGNDPLSQITTLNGIDVNTSDIVNGPAANMGTWVGMCATDATPDANVIFGGVGAAGGEANRVDIWSRYNQVFAPFVNFDNTNSWAATDVTGTRFQVKNLNLNNGVTFIQGRQLNLVHARNLAISQANANGSAICGIVLDPTATTNQTPDARCTLVRQGTPGVAAANYRAQLSTMSGYVGVGQRVLAPLQFGESGGIFYGDDGTAFTRAQFQVDLWY